MLDTWLGRSREGRDTLIEESYTMSLREGDWKYIRPASQSGYEWIKEDKDLESGLVEADQLYDLSRDPSEQLNLAAQEPDIVQRLAFELARQIESQGTRPGFRE
jgi:hypothetical protein